MLQLPNEPVSFSQVKTDFGHPLSSGLSLPDMVENALQSVVEIRTDVSGGTGFIVNDAGLVVTNKHVIRGANSINLRLVNGDRFNASVVGGHATLDLAYLLIGSDAEFEPIAVGGLGCRQGRGARHHHRLSYSLRIGSGTHGEPRDRLRQAQWPDSDRRARESWQ